MRHTLTIVAGMLVGLLAAVPVGAQEGQAGHSYVVRDYDGGYTGAGAGSEVELPELDVSGDRQPMRVVQGPETAWLVGLDGPVTVESAAVVYAENEPVRPGAPGILVRGWGPARVASYDSFTYELTRGDRDRQVAGTDARHYELRAYVERTGSLDGSDQRYEVTADLWILPDVRFSWAPFGPGTQTLPALLPRLREELGPRLEELGLVGRAVVHLDFAMLEDGREAGGSEQVTGFEISELEPAEAPEIPLPVVEGEVMAEVEGTLMERPGPVCEAVASGELPADLADELESGARTAVVGFLSAGCQSAELYMAMLEDPFEEDPAAFCRKVNEAADPGAFAEAVFTPEQRAAFLGQLPAEQQQALYDELSGYCRR